MTRSLALLPLALLVAGCLGPEIGPDFGDLELTSFRAVAKYDALTGTAHVAVDGAVRAENAQGVRVEMYVVDRPCAMGPESDPDGWLARETHRIGDVPNGHRETNAYRSEFDVRVNAGEEFAAIAAAHAENTIGPIFGECKSFRAVPS